jgi:hypothetical protein
MYGNTEYVQREFAENGVFENWLWQWNPRLKQHRILTHLRCVLKCGGTTPSILKNLQDTPLIFDRQYAKHK